MGLFYYSRPNKEVVEFEAFCQDCGKRRDGGGRGHCESLCKLGSSRPEKAEECGVEVRQINVSSSKQTRLFSCRMNEEVVPVCCSQQTFQVIDGQMQTTRVRSNVCEEISTRDKQFPTAFPKQITPSSFSG